MNRRASTFIRQLGQTITPTGGYGRLYNLFATNNDKFAPFGWHIPTTVEYQILSTYLGGNYVSGDKLKITGTTYWNLNDSTTDEVGFSLKGGGYRSADDGSYFNIKDYTALRTSSIGVFGYTSWYAESNASYFLYDFRQERNNKGLSVRCIRPKSSYGALYNWHVVNDARGLAPINCHIPTYTEWETLKTYLGGQSTAGLKVKENGTTNWNNHNTSAANSSGFLALPNGYRSFNNGTFNDFGHYGFYWSSSERNASEAYYEILNTSSNAFTNDYNSKKGGFAIRCLVDTSDETVTDYDGNIYDTIVIGTQRWLVQDLNVTHYRDGSDITNVTNNATWATLTTEAYCYYNNTLPIANQPITVVDYDGNTYDVIEIGRQLWTKQNFKCTHLNDGTDIPEVTDNTAWAGLTIGAWCYYDNNPINL